MLSYKHAFHSGNHADVLKHVILLSTINKFSQKAKPFCVIDTHAGAGLYAMSDEQVQLNKEYESGIAKVSDYSSQLHDIKQYVEIISTYKQQGLLPGSPVIAADVLREQDELTLMELHPNEYEKLKKTKRLASAHIHNRDGFEGLLAITPPRIRRGIVLIDPPYEQLEEYQKVEECISALLTRWPNVCVLLWYPLLSARAKAKSGRSEKMLQKLADNATSGAFYAQLLVDTKTSDTGMYGSGILALNPPWQLFETARDITAELSQQLNACEHTVEWLIQPD
ncbi:23S rRNA (adenine(2030)-N(6))-methyltransferase RlmJ [Alteromonas facilis]|uniref:23S rRNA (adenine(2030)-N(6))-methyltransferase RlmJ n=1 Tax=Alteromonas facilis TaxID=2048004 RepID=UPI000C28FBF4|nr:23S rRNA (adenine(2030)-N(6))-methyltransferase RlmJ [Alteromonas facilis]